VVDRHVPTRGVASRVTGDEHTGVQPDVRAGDHIADDEGYQQPQFPS
jgi:hypothetical protein